MTDSNPNAELQAAMDAPLLKNQARVFYCQLCGAITYIKLTQQDPGAGDPHAHNLYHAMRGETFSPKGGQGTNER